MQDFLEFLDALDGFLYYPVLIIVLIVAGLYFSFRSRFAQVRLCFDSVRLVTERPGNKNSISSFGALMVSTASRVGTGNIIGVSTAICLGGPGAVFWMWVLAILGGASAMAESTLAQIFKKHDADTGRSYGGPAFYIEAILHSKATAVIFSLFLIATYAFGFNALASYNLQSTFSVYNFYDAGVTPLIIGTVTALITGWCMFGGAKRIVKVTGLLVPVMGIVYVLTALCVIVMKVDVLPDVLKMIFADAFNFRAIGSGIAGSCLVYGIKRGLYSNEAGVGSAPNAAAYAETTHPVKQGLIQMLSVYIDTIMICSATAFMCLMSGTEITHEAAGAQYVQEAMKTIMGESGPVFITVIMALFAFTTLLGNLFYVDNALAYINGKKVPGKKFMTVFKIICALVILVGAVLPMSTAWAVADITMDGMTLINIPCIMVGSGIVFKALADYEKQRRSKINPVFKASDIGLDPSKLDYWK
ncbi:MAG: alanine:cation symporter family protein [Synergistaceae bacterium]|nr:alanine:cation symporter family protein [Synergistaceae bacterium]